MDEAARWIKQAREDRETADFLSESGRYAHASFLYQQAVEKGLKAVLLEKEAGLPRVHDCFVLAKKAEAPHGVVQKADVLTPYYFRTRYPDTADVEIAEEDIEDIREAVKEVFRWIEKQL
ncbi:MAG: hypothetical protein MAG715_01144 [Methanonatronarchaeales archaeon]|nr:hypothetical protein [Methanonatronarchaeales archaeon]